MPVKQEQVGPGICMDTEGRVPLQTRFLTVYSPQPFTTTDPIKELEFTHFVYTSTSAAGYEMLANVCHPSP